MGLRTTGGRPVPLAPAGLARTGLLGRIEVIADDDVNEDLINLHHHRTPFDTLPTLLRDYRVEALDTDGGWRVIARTAQNRRRRETHTPAEPVTTSAIRVVVEATNGAASAHVVAVRAHE